LHLNILPVWNTQELYRYSEQVLNPAWWCHWLAGPASALLLEDITYRSRECVLLLDCTFTALFPCWYILIHLVNSPCLRSFQTCRQRKIQEHLKPNYVRVLERVWMLSIGSQTFVGYPLYARYKIFRIPCTCLRSEDSEPCSELTDGGILGSFKQAW
jgi:hypothetical protein